MMSTLHQDMSKHFSPVNTIKQPSGLVDFNSTTTSSSNKTAITHTHTQTCTRTHTQIHTTHTIIPYCKSVQCGIEYTNQNCGDDFRIFNNTPYPIPHIHITFSAFTTLTIYKVLSFQCNRFCIMLYNNNAY